MSSRPFRAARDTASDFLVAVGTYLHLPGFSGLFAATHAALDRLSR